MVYENKIRRIKRIWNHVEEDFPTKSTEFLMAVVIDRYRLAYDEEIDNGDVAAAIAPN